MLMACEVVYSLFETGKLFWDPKICISGAMISVSIGRGKVCKVVSLVLPRALLDEVKTPPCLK